MKKGICFYFGFNSPVDELAKKIKGNGFDCVMTNADKKFNHQTGSIKKQIKVFKKYGLELSSLHMRYNRAELPEFWTNSKLGDKLERNLIKDVKIAGKYGFTCVVVHSSGTPNKIGLTRYERILKIAEKYNIPLAFENLNDDECLAYIFENLKHPLVKFCYDIGHNNCFHPDKDYLALYGDKLITLHLHSNDGTYDMHTLNKYGNVNWEEFARKLAKINPNINLDYEILMLYRKNETILEVLQETIKQATALEKMILKEVK